MTDDGYKAETRRKKHLQQVWTLEQFIDLYRRYNSGHFFDADTLRFFATRFCYGKGIKRTPNGLYFMHSDKRCFEDSRRVYVIRWWSVETSRFYNVYRSMSRSEIDRVWRDITTDTDFDTAKEFDTAKFDEENPVRW